MSEQKSKGSFLYKILIVVLTAVLVSSILYPKFVTDEENSNVAVSRYRMEEIYKAALQYHKYNETYSDSLSKIFNFIRTDERYAHYVDSVVIGGLDSVVTKLSEFKERQLFVKSHISQATDSVMIDSVVNLQNEVKFASRQLAGYVEYVHDRMKNLPNAPTLELTEAFKIIDSKQFTLDMEIVKNSLKNGNSADAFIGCDNVLSVIRSVSNQIARVIELVPAHNGESMGAIAYCPTTNKPFVLSHVDTSVIKYLNIYSPIDENDIARVEASFVKSKIGGLKLENHGKIESNEKSWEMNR